MNDDANGVRNGGEIFAESQRQQKLMKFSRKKSLPFMTLSNIPGQMFSSTLTN